MDKEELNKWSVIILFLMIAYLSFIILRSFLVPLFIGAIIAYMIHPLHSRLIRITKSGKLSAVILSLVAIAVMVALSALILPEMITELSKFHQSPERIIIEQWEELKQCPPDSGDLKCKSITYVLKNVDEETLRDTGIAIAKMVSKFIVDNVMAFFGNLPNLVLQLTIILFSTAHFLHNGKAIVDRILVILPLKASQKLRIKQRIDNVMKAVIFGNLMTAIMEGVIAAIIFLALGISMPFIWGLLIMFFALIPPLGAAIIWAPATIILFILGEHTKAIILGVLCLAIMGYIDNVLRPMKISKKVRLSSLWVLLGVLGGLGTFGFVGIFIGPLVLALFVTFLALVSEELMG